MANLNVLIEAAKHLEEVLADEDTLLEQRRSAHKMLEKSRRADMKNLFDSLKENVPKIRDWVKCSNLAILTSATKYIAVLHQLDFRYQREKENLFRTQKELKERIEKLLCHGRMVGEQPSPTENDDDDKTIDSSKHPSHRPANGGYRYDNAHKPSGKKGMVSVEVQANENDVRAEASRIECNGMNVGAMQHQSFGDNFRNLPSPTDSFHGENLFFKSSPTNGRKSESFLLPLGCLSNKRASDYLCKENMVSVDRNLMETSPKKISRRKRKNFLA